MVRVLCVGPKNTPVTGQSYAFDYFVNNSKCNVDILYNSGGNKLLSLLQYPFKVLFRRFFCSYDVVYFTSSRTRIGFARDLLLVTLFKNKSKIVNHLHGADFIQFRQGCSRCLKRVIDYIYDSIPSSIILTDGMREHYNYYPKMDVNVIPNFFDKKSLGTLHKTRKDNLLERKFKVLFLSNIMPDKGLTELIDAIKHLKNKQYHVSLSIVGASLGFECLDRYVKETCAAHKYITYDGPVYNDEKADILSENHFIVLPSYYKTEAQPISLIEGMANGCVLITTKHNYLPELVNELNGSLVEVRDWQSIADALESYFNDLDKITTISEHNRNIAIEKFSATAFVNSIDDVLVNCRRN